MISDLSAFSERLNIYIKATGNSVRGFERSIGVSNGWVSDVKSKVDINVVSEISLKYPDLNIRWLFSGEGSMLRSDNATSDKKLLDICKRLVGVYEEKERALNELKEAVKSMED